MNNQSLIDTSARELAALDPRCVFWVHLLGVETAPGSGASADDDWVAFGWSEARDALEAWLDNLDPATAPAEFRWDVRSTLRLCFRATARSTQARGYQRLPSFAFASPDPLPLLQFDDTETAAFESLPLETVRELATGRRRLAMELQSHQAVWEMLYDEMTALDQTNTSQINTIVREAYAAQLGLVEDADQVLGDFDETWRAINHIDVPIADTLGPKTEQLEYRRPRRPACGATAQNFRRRERVPG